MRWTEGSAASAATRPAPEAPPTARAGGRAADARASAVKRSGTAGTISWVLLKLAPPSVK